MEFLNKGVKTRKGSSLVHTVNSVRREVVYKRIGEAQRLLILDASGHLYDSTDLSTPILTITAMTDFSSVTIFNRAYITPHNSLTGLPGEFVYVYNGSGVARKAAGVAPSSFTLTAVDDVASGKVEAGTHLIGVANIYASGFVTAPGGFVEVTNAGSLKLDIGNIAVGGSGVVGRILVSTKRVVDFNGDFSHQTYYFVPGGQIDDNITTSIVLDYYDADLLDESTYLLEQLSEIPAGVGLALVRGMMVSWGEDANPEIVRVSVVGEPESMNEVDGFITCNPGDSGGGVKNCCEYRSQLAMMKSQRSYVTQPSTDPPANWEVLELDASVGTECHGLARALDFGANIEDRVFICDRQGLRVCTGTFDTENILTFNIQDIWDRINPLYFHLVEIAIDPVENKIYIAVPLDSATTPSVVLYGDYSEGLTIDTIKWTLWDFPNDARSIVVDVINSVTVFKFGSLDGNVYKYDTAQILDYNNAIDNWVEFPHFPSDDAEDLIYNYIGIKIRVKNGAGNLLVTGKGLDDATSFTGETIVLSTSPGKSKFSGFNFNDERMSIKLRCASTNEYFTLLKFSLYLTLLWSDRPRT